MSKRKKLSVLNYKKELKRLEGIYNQYNFKRDLDYVLDRVELIERKLFNEGFLMTREKSALSIQLYRVKYFCEHEKQYKLKIKKPRSTSPKDCDVDELMSIYKRYSKYIGELMLDISNNTDLTSAQIKGLKVALNPALLHCLGKMKSFRDVDYEYYYNKYYKSEIKGGI